MNKRRFLDWLEDLPYTHPELPMVLSGVSAVVALVALLLSVCIN
jgi:hypothetical protein